MEWSLLRVNTMTYKKVNIHNSCTLIDYSTLYCGVMLYVITVVPTPHTNYHNYTVTNACPLQKRTEEKMIVIYTTSFRGVRTTFEDCKYLISLFYNLRVKIEERDVYINQQYFRELEERLEGKVTVPQVFISGQHIGVLTLLSYSE